MYEKVNPGHPDKVADRIAGALVDYAYTKKDDPKIAVEVLIGHGICHIIAETSVSIPYDFVLNTVTRIVGYHNIKVVYDEHPQDVHLAENQSARIRCGDNGIFKGTPVTDEQKTLTKIAKRIWDVYECDGKYILDNGKLIVCQSNAQTDDLRDICREEGFPNAVINPLGFWTGGIDVDTGITGRKLGSDMADSVTGGSINGKDLSKADVSVNIYAWMLAQEKGEEVWLSCAIGDTEINGVPYSEIVDKARQFIKSVGGFEKFSEWGLIR